ncbi:hypothetical protein E1B28_013846 [Marasmius oreades]|uniref:Uncharacterized protein n=1 Tax=Marasmius oreades TaxID=181124 RepID=A0A9P7ULI4_9AGAR|nr:uncharacterized protein E1B28_013846 [Marasmius oreades]KAG7085306.1 hypothetical protein E1B28_013846 [Marasmius oreades]
MGSRLSVTVTEHSAGWDNREEGAFRFSYLAQQPLAFSRLQFHAAEGGGELGNLETHVSVRFSSIRQLVCFPETYPQQTLRSQGARPTERNDSVPAATSICYSFDPFLLCTPVKNLIIQYGPR